MVSANLSLPYIHAAQAQKHVTHNEAIRALDAIVQLAVLDRDLAAPPGSPAEGDRYIVAAAPTGAWSGRAGDVAAFQDGAWAFFSPREGWRAWISDEAGLLVYDGSGWTAVAGGGGVNPAPLVGVNTVADSVNRLAAKSDAVLFSHDDVTPGSGDMRLVINKADAGGVASVVFQDAFSGRAEFGLAAGDLFELKVSPDGTGFTSALSIDPADGVVELPQGAVLGGTDGIDVNPGSDVDVDLLTVGVTGAPKLSWLDDDQAFGFSAGVIASSYAAFNSDGSVFYGDTDSMIATSMALINSETGGHFFEFFSTGPWAGAGRFGVYSQTSSLDMMSFDGATADLTINGDLRAPNLATTASAANAFLDSGDGNNLLRSTSSLRYKQDVEPMDPEAAARIVDGAEPIWYRSTIPTDRQDWSWYGLSAEAMAELDPRFVHWGYAEEDYETVELQAYREGQTRKVRRLKEGARLVPDGVAYDRLVVALLLEHQRLKQRVAELEAMAEGE